MHSEEELNSPSSQELAIGSDIIQYLDFTEYPHIYARFCLVKTLSHQEVHSKWDPVVLELSLDYPDTVDGLKDIKTTFRFGGPEEVLELLLSLKVLEKVPESSSSPPGNKSQLGQTMVRLILPERDIARRCAQCGQWEQQSENQARLAVCSGCKLAWFCDSECQRENWKEGLPTPHKKVCSRGRK